MRRIGTAIAVAGIVALAGCSGNSAADSDADVEFVPCSQTECSGVLPSGADFEILLPDDWGGTLAVFSHGLRMSVPPVPGLPSPQADGDQAEPSRPPDPNPDGPEPAPRWGEGDNTIADVMLQAGYAVAGAATGRSGWSVRSQIVAAEELHQYFVENIGSPSRVYAWGESIGGLSSVRLAELHPEWVTGAAALCAPMSGPVPSFALALDAGFAVRELLDPELTIVGFASMEDAIRERDSAVGALRKAAARGAKGQAQILFLASLVGLPLQTQVEPGNNLASQVDAAVAGLAHLLDQNTTQRHLVEQVVGGNPSGNSGTDYEQRIDDQRRQQIDAVSRGSVQRLYRKLLDGERVESDPEAERALAAQGELVGDIKSPVLTLHNTSDPYQIVQNESWYRERVGTLGPEIRANLVNAFVVPPGSYSADRPATEGAGGCNFEARTLIGVIIQLDLWARKGQYPGRDSAAKAFAGQKVTLDFVPPPWPAMSVSPLDPPMEPDPEDVYSPSPTVGQAASPLPAPSSTPGTTGPDKGKRPRG